MPLTLMYLTNNPAVALIAEKNGVGRIWIDLETLGKEERQYQIDSVKSHHSVQDIEILSNMLTASELMVRINPIHPGSDCEIEQVIAAGADIIMLPMWKTPEEVRRFLSLVNGRVKTTLLLETREGVACIDEVLKAGGFDDIHIGLNDLHLSYGLDFMFELLANGTVEMLCEKFRKAGIPYGFGGIARIGEGELRAEKILSEHIRLKSSQVILSRAFFDVQNMVDITAAELVFSEGIQELRAKEAAFQRYDKKALQLCHADVQKTVFEIVSQKGRHNDVC